jgi:cellulose synthase/poly-beta-1,6-N-acetylglucosamine synthase-like glycosyltransferase
MQLIILIIAVLLFLCYAGLLIYYYIAWKSIPNQEYKNNHHFQTTMSIIIAARNESVNIKACLETVTNQTYPAHLFEILVIDDHSTDDTATIVKAFPSPNVKLISLREFTGGNQLNSYKKKAIDIGIQQSTGKLIVTTDADCLVNENWLKSIALFYEKHKPAFIAAPVAIQNGFSFIEIFQALDFMTLQGITGASVHKKIHSMCNGANLAYERSAFYEVDGFKGIDAIASGDDMLLMHKIYLRFPERVMFLNSPDTIVQTAPVKTIKAFFNQRIRWASKADKYDDKRITAVLFVVYFFNVLLLLLPVSSLFFTHQNLIPGLHCSIICLWLLLLILKTIIELFFLFPVASFFNKRSLLWLFPFMQPFHILYTIIAGWLGKFGTYQWKERKVK